MVASLPCYSEANVDKQRGRGVFERSILGLQRLNSAGYGVPGSGLSLDLVYNPGGAFLSPAQAALEPAYKQELLEVPPTPLLQAGPLIISAWHNQSESLVRIPRSSGKCLGLRDYLQQPTGAE